jgi:hypothetical protein
MSDSFADSESRFAIGERFGDFADGASRIRASSLDGEPAVGAARTCQVAQFGPFAPRAVKERLLAFDNLAMSSPLRDVPTRSGTPGSHDLPTRVVHRNGPLASWS